MLYYNNRKSISMCIIFFFFRVVHYLVHISEGNELNVTTAKTYKANDSGYIINDPPTSNQLSVAVQLETDTGYVSQMSEVVSFISNYGGNKY